MLVCLIMTPPGCGGMVRNAWRWARGGDGTRKQRPLTVSSSIRLFPAARLVSSVLKLINQHRTWMPDVKSWLGVTKKNVR